MVPQDSRRVGLSAEGSGLRGQGFWHLYVLLSVLAVMWLWLAVAGVDSTWVGVVSGVVAGVLSGCVARVVACRLCRSGSALGVVRVVVYICVTGVAGSAVVVGHGHVLRLMYLIAIVVVAVAVFVDAAEHRLPDLATVPLMAIGVLVLPWLSGVSWWQPVAGAVVAGVWALVVALVADQGLGDVKLSAGLGAWLAALSWSVLAVGMLAGQVFTAVVLSVRWVRVRRRGQGFGQWPLGPALAVGALVGMIVQVVQQ